MRAPQSLSGGHMAAAAPGRKARGAYGRRIVFRRRTGGNSQKYPRVSVGLFLTSSRNLSAERGRYD